MSGHGKAALLLEELLLDPVALQQAMEQLLPLMPAGYLDQVQAASDQVLAAAHNCYADAKGVPGWLRLGLLTEFVSFSLGESTTCVHQPSIGRPEPVITCAWKPRLAVCAKCEHLLRVPRGSVADRTCDCCGTVVDGVIDVDPMWCGFVGHGPMIFKYGVCASCRDDLPEVQT